VLFRSAGLKAAVPADVLPQLRAGAAAATRPAGIVSRPQGVADLTVWAGVGLALLAGLILNVMPCVLPVIPLRVLSLARMAGESRRRRIAMGLAFAGGIVLFFVAIAAVNVVFRLAWQRSFSVGGLFGFQGVRIAMALVLVALAANLFGLFTVVVPRRLAAMNRPAQGRGGCASSMGMGLMMAVLATPCSFAILAQAFAWSQLVSLWLGTIAIVLIGVGMAVPHAVLAAFPALLEKLPRPGRWMELFKQSMGFLLLPVAVWLIFAGPGDSYPAWVVAYAVVLAACLWVGGSWVRHDAPPARKGIVRAVAAALAVAAGIWMLTPPAPAAVPFEPFDLARIQQAGRDRRTVLIQFTSATCLSCYYLEKTVYNDPAVARALAGREVLPVKGDVTDASGPAGKMLREQFTGAPPLTVILPPGGGKVVRLDGKFTKAKLIEALDEAAAGDKHQIRSTKPACRPAGSVP